MLSILPHLIVVLAAFAGTALTIYIFQTKRRHTTIVCPLGHDCSTVIHSPYSRFLGLPVELLGMAYYAAIMVVYISFILFPTLANSYLTFITFPLTMGAFLFSLYLTFIQGMTLKQWCTWCLSSAGLSTIIFFVTLFGAPAFLALLIPLLQEYRPVLLGLHLFGLALGLGGATIADSFFFRFLKDLRISERESDTLRAISQMIWLGLGILVLSGTGMFLANMTGLLGSDKFLVKLIVVGVIIVNGAFLNLYITPKLIHISFGDPHKHHKGELRHERKLAFALGAVSFVSWYSAFILGLLNFSPLPFWRLLGVYVGLLLVAITGSQIMERLIARRGWDLSHQEKMSPTMLEES